MATRKCIFVNTDGDYEEGAGFYETGDYINSSAGAGDAGKPVVLDAGGQIDATMINDADIAHDSTGAAAASTVHTAFPLLVGGRDFTGIQQYDSDKTFTANSNQIPDVKWVTEQLGNAQLGTEWQDSVLDIQTDNTLDPGASPTNGDRYIIENATSLHANFGTINKDINGNADTLADDDIVQYDSTASEFRIAMSPTTGTFTSDDSNNDQLMYFNGSVWTTKDFEATTASLGCQKSGLDIRADLQAFGGIALNTNSMYVDVDELNGDGLTTTGSAPTKNLVIDWATTFTIDGADAKAFKASDLASTTNGEGAALVGIEDTGGYTAQDNLEALLDELYAQIGGDSSTAYNFAEDSNVLTDNDSVYAALNKLNNKWGDLASVANGEGASIVAIEDAGAYTTETDVEGALQELYGLVAQGGVNYAAGTGGVSKGDLVYVSANDTVLPLPITGAGSSNFGIGLCAADTLAAATVKVLESDTVIAGVLTTATAGTKYYWDGSALTSTIPTPASAYVWRVGVAKNATDLHVDVEFVKKNAT